MPRSKHLAADSLLRKPATKSDLQKEKTNNNFEDYIFYKLGNIYSVELDKGPDFNIDRKLDPAIRVYLDG
jgi:hypothetical protein